MGNVYAGIDIGGTNTVIGIFDQQLKLVVKKTILTWRPEPFFAATNPSPFLDLLAAEVRNLEKECGNNSYLRSVGIGVPGKVDSIRGIVRRASNLGWHEVHLASEMSIRLNIPVVIEHDVRLFALGEAMAGAGVGYKNLICLTIGTGIAAGIIVDGEMVRGGDWSAGEIGHDAVDGESTVCSCGKTGCLETIVSAPGIARIAEELVRSGDLLSLAELKGRISAYDVFQACVNGDKAAEAIFDRAGTLLGRKLTQLVYALNPEIIIIGGGVAAAGEVLLSPIRRELWKQYPEQQLYLKIMTGQLADEAGLIGAVYSSLKSNSEIFK